MDKLVESLRAKSFLKGVHPSVLQALKNVDRRHYCPSADPYKDEPHDIGYNATISAPHMHAFALEHLKNQLKDGARVLDVGSGSGYLTACMADMVGPSGIVFGVDHIEGLVEKSISNIQRDRPELLESGRIKILATDGRVGLAEHGPFDAIHVGASADNLPNKLVEQLKEGGRMVIPVQVVGGDVQEFVSIDKLANGEIKRTKLLDVRYIPLTEVGHQLASR